MTILEIINEKDDKIYLSLPELSNSHINSIMERFAKTGRIGDVLHVYGEYLKITSPPFGIGYCPTKEDRVAINEFLDGIKHHLKLGSKRCHYRYI